MDTKTLTWVSDVKNEPDQYGNLYVNVAFDDGSVGFIGAKPENAPKHKERLDALLAAKAPIEIETLDAGTSQSGKPKVKLVSYPGFTPPDSGGGTKTTATASSKGDGNWESAPERMFKNLSIEAQGSLGRLTELASHFVSPDGKFHGDDFVTAVNAIKDAHPGFLAAVRSGAEVSEGGKPSDALTTPTQSSGPAQAPQGESSAAVGSPPSSAAGNHPDSTTPDGSPGPDLMLARNGALKLFGNQSAVEAAYEELTHAPLKFTMIPTDRLNELVSAASPDA